MDSQHIEQRAAEWLAHRDSESWTASDDVALQAWLNESTANRVAYLRLGAAWHQANRFKALGAGVKPGVVPAPGEWFQTKATKLPEVSAASRQAFHHPYRAVAASVLIAIAVSIGWFLWSTGPTYSTEVGGLEAVPLPDGSKATLNTNSEIRVAVTETERRVDLKQGEAFFDVAKDPRRPFVVKAGAKRIVAVGTKFSVRREGDDVRVVVTEGQVRIERGRGGGREQVAQLSAGAIARATDVGTLIQQKPLPEAEELLSWRSGYLVFRDMPLADAVAEFNRYNAKQIVIEDARVAAIRIGGNFRSTNVDAFVRLLEDGFPIRVERRDDQIILARL